MLIVAALALMTYVEEQPDGFRILLRESPVGTERAGGFATIMSDVASQVEHRDADINKDAADQELAAPPVAAAIETLLAAPSKDNVNATQKAIEDITVYKVGKGIDERHPGNEKQYRRSKRMFERDVEA